jgi:hypothetical protein
LCVFLLENKQTNQAKHNEKEDTHEKLEVAAADADDEDNEN